jgi:phospholipid-binding lipoprotein MlaA
MLLCSPVTTGTQGFNFAIAAEEQQPEPEAAPNVQKVCDPYERFNRKIFAFNDCVYFHVLKPVALAYSTCLPSALRTAVDNGFRNIVFPSRFINCALQGKWDKVLTETVRFVINSTMGIGGMIDLAQSNFRIAGYDADFGQTLAIWGVQSGPFLMVPILGPFDERDLFGYVVDSAMDPVIWIPADWWVSVTVETWKYLNRISLEIGQYEELKRASLDPYVAMREGYMQSREHLISK